MYIGVLLLKRWDMHKKKSLISIRISDLMQGMHEFVFTCRAADFVDRHLAEAGFTKDILVNVVADKSESEVTVTIKTSTVADFTCDICLVPVSRELSGSLQLGYVFGEPVDENQIVDDEYRFIDKKAEFIDLAEDVCEILLLSLPLKVTCISNPDCRLYGEVKKNKESQTEEKSSWHESLEKLKNKYR